MGAVDDPLHSHCRPETIWATGNVAEAIPGVPTPLSWTLQHYAIEAGARGAFADLGVITGRAASRPVGVDDATIGIFFGHPAGNVTTMLKVAAAMPGNSVEALLEQIFGESGPTPEVQRSPRRWPAIAAKLPVGIAAGPRRLEATRRRAHAFSVEALRRLGPDSARTLLVEARDVFAAVVRPHAFVTFMGQGLYERVAQLARAAGMPGAELTLAGGCGGMEELDLAAALWDMADGRLAMDRFLAAYGHHGPDEGELSNRSWREDPAPLLRTIATIRRLDRSEHPREVERRRRAERADAERRLIAALPRLQRAPARLLLRLATRYFPLREAGRSAFHRAVDVARASARILGTELARGGHLEEPDDVFYLTLDELAGRCGHHFRSADARHLVAHRRERRAHYLTLDVPSMWTGMPTPTLRADRRPDGTAGTLTGLAVSAGEAEGTARVVADPATCVTPLEPGEILVCRTTDPSWVAMFLGAAGLVIDIGGAMSHGAIVARELGIPCVINTQTATVRIATGDHVRVDGSRGLVEIRPTQPSDEE